MLGLSRQDALRRLTQLLSLAGLALAAMAAWMKDPSDPDLHFGFFNPNYITGLACAIGFFSVLAAWNMPAKEDPSTPDSHYRGEFFGMMLFSLAGVAMIGKVNDLVWLFIALELVS